MSDFPIKDVPVVKTQHCPNCETLAIEVERWRLRAEQYNNGWTAMGVKAQALVERQRTEIERLRVEAEAHYDRGYYDGSTHLLEQHEALRDALVDLLHAVCGEKGFAEAVRRDSGRVYPWPALELAEAKALAALGQSK
jgi:hypothetical protein